MSGVHHVCFRATRAEKTEIVYTFEFHVSLSGNFLPMFNCRMCTEDIASILGVQNTRRQASSRYASHCTSPTPSEGAPEDLRVRGRFSILGEEMK